MPGRKKSGKKLNRIKEILEKSGKKMPWLAEQLDYDYDTILRYCNNRRQPSLDTLFDIAKLLKVKPSELLNE